MLSLERWRQIIVPRMHPIHFYQLTSIPSPLKNACSTLVREYAYQIGGGILGRSNVRDAIARAEKMLTEVLGYSPGHQWFCDEVVRKGNSRRLVTNSKNVKAVGKELVTIIGEYDVTLLDLDGDGVNEAFQVILPDYVWDSTGDRIAIYFTSGDQWNSALSMAFYEIRPISARSTSGGTIIQGSSWLLVKPELYQGDYSHSTLSGTFALSAELDSNYAETVQVATVGVDRDGQGGGVWPVSSCAAEAYETCGDGLCDSFSEINFCIIDGSTGLIESNFDLCTGSLPSRYRISYLAGDDIRKWETTIAQLAAAELHESICSCADIGLGYWLEDLSQAHDEKNRKFMRLDAFNNPWGTRRGHVTAWLFASKFLNPGGILI